MTYSIEKASEIVRGIFKTVSANHQCDQVNGTESTPAAPNTGSFRATQSGFIRTVEAPTSYGYAGMKFARNFGLQVGALVSREVKEDIKREIFEALEAHFEQKDLIINHPDNLDLLHIEVLCEGISKYKTQNRIALGYQGGSNYSMWYLV